jgi:hypothetical protein
MAINFKPKLKSTVSQEDAPQQPKVAPKGVPAKTSGLSFLKRGKEAQKIAAQEEAKAEMRSKDNIFRFWIPKDGEGDITFLDGDLTDGILDIPFYHEHNVYMNGSWMNWFICTQDEEPCPICEGGGNHSYVGVMTVIDHSEYTSKKDNSIKKDVVKLFVAKRDTIKLLQKQAVKRGGLRGCRFEVSRTGDKSPAVGSAFEFTEKLTDAELAKKYGAKNPKDQDRSKPVNYDDYLKGLYMPASELRKLGFGAAAAPVGSADVGDGENYNM